MNFFNLVSSKVIFQFSPNCRGGRGGGGSKSHRGLKSLACYFFSMDKYHYMTSLTSLQIIS